MRLYVYLVSFVGFFIAFRLLNYSYGHSQDNALVTIIAVGIAALVGSFIAVQRHGGRRY